MSTFSISRLLRGLVLGVAATVSLPALSEEITLKYAFFAPAGTFPGKQMTHWAEEVNKRTNGKVKVETFPGGSLLGAREMWDGVTMGVTDIGLSAPSYDPGRFPLTSGMALPLGFENATEASRVLWEVTKEFQPKEFENFKVLAMFTSEPGHIQSKEPVRNTEDLANMRLRATGSGVPVIEALGGSAVGMSMPDVPQAVQTGVIDGTMTSREVLRDFRLAENLKYVTEYPMVVSTFAAVMDKKKWDALPDDVKKVFDELGEEMHAWTGRYHDEENVNGALEWAQKEQGLTILTLSDEETARWDAKMEPIVEEWIVATEAKGLPAKQYIERIKELQKK
ncbi:TRAP transporter substrate-binding protein [Pusillimonas sp. DMV24BSW_D]|uniref:TRAP transporter substrate-binding protein n=1 Tax=Neopusillimonas aestuarii TaxID=2716226 RepID=UPI001407A2A3|nr:TRAP transporter substrate-binding protein [Pusillimonas sp. DMV24BSW_D]QIM47873.1 TRAP transporter substrate-binding protein [Pusillimonas sp. DMV24BSW_D]